MWGARGMPWMAEKIRLLFSRQIDCSDESSRFCSMSRAKSGVDTHEILLIMLCMGSALVTLLFYQEERPPNPPTD